MKTFLIAILAILLIAAAAVTRPGKREFMLYLLDQRVPPSGSWTAADLEAADKTAHTVTIKNRILWTDVQQDGKTLYTGLFSHWVARSPQAELPAPKAQDVANLIKLASN